MGLNRVFGVGAALFLATAAMASPRESVTYTGVQSNADLGDPSNVFQAATFTGTYTATKIRMSGTLSSLTDFTWPTDSRIEVTTPDGQVFDIIPFTQTGSFVTVSTGGDILVDIPVPVTAAGTWSFQFYEDYDDAFDAPDASWDTITLTLDDYVSGGCCVGGNCSIMTPADCQAAGGTYNGNGSNCGAVSYTIAPSSATYSTISGTGTLAPNASDEDDGGETVSLPFSFGFFENSYDSVWICSNGFLQFGGDNDVEYFNSALPNPDEVHNAIFPLWDDYNTSNSGAPNGQGDVYYQTDGVAPNRTFTVEWFNVTQYTEGGDFPLTSESFQAILHEGSNNIEFRYGSLSAPCSTGLDQCSGTGDDGDDRTVGVQDSTGTTAYSVGGSTIGSGNMSLMVTYANVSPCGPRCGTADFNCDGDIGTDSDINAFFLCLSGTCPSAPCTNSADFNGDGDTGTDSDIEAFFRVLSGGHC